MHVNVMLMNLVKESLRMIKIVAGLNLVRKDLFASGREVSVEVNIAVDNAGVGCS